MPSDALVTVRSQGAIRVHLRSSAAKFFRSQMGRPNEVNEYLTHLEKERDVSPHTVKAYGRDLDAFSDFFDRHYGSWKWETVDRLGLRGFLGELQRKGLSKRSAARALSAVRSLYRFLQEHHEVPNNIARAARVPKLEKRLPGYLDRS